MQIVNVWFKMTQRVYDGCLLLLSLKYDNTNWLVEFSLNINCRYLYKEINWLFESLK